MMTPTKIQWASVSWNPMRGCRRVSAGCERCYAEIQAARFSGPGQPYEGLVRIGDNGPRWTGDARLIEKKLAEPLRLKPLKEGRHRVFVNSMSDLFYGGFSNEEIASVFMIMASCPQHDFLVLTKRPRRAQEWFRWAKSGPSLDAHLGDGSVLGELLEIDENTAWPLPNLWLGVSVEDQATADERIPLLLDTPAAVRWVSYEPALGPVDFGRYLGGRYVRGERPDGFEDRARPTLAWIVVGGESGNGARPFDLGWARSTVEACRAEGTPVFVKQLGSATGLRDRKGGDWTEWPDDLRVRQFPTTGAE